VNIPQNPPELLELSREIISEGHEKFTKVLSARVPPDPNGNYHHWDKLRHLKTPPNNLLINALIEEAISSSQLEGAATTRKVAKEMLRQKREPKNRSERMIVNNYRAMQYINEIVSIVHQMPSNCPPGWRAFA